MLLNFLLIKESWSSFHKNIKQHNWASNQYIRMISEGSCDTEDWSNDAENSALITGINYILIKLKKKTAILNCNNISDYYCCF